MSGEAPAVREALAVYAPEAPETERVPPGYRQTEVGVIPEDWEVENLASLGSGSITPIKAGPFGSALTKDTYASSGYKVYGQEQVIRGDYQYGDYFVPYAKFKELESCSVKAGDILLSLVGTAGKLLVVPRDAPEGIINPRLIRFSFDKKRVDSEFFKELFEADQIQSYLERYAQGGTMGVLNAGILRAVSVTLPTLQEQRAIAAALSDVDVLIAALDKLIAKKRAVKTAAIRQLLTGKQRLPGFRGEWEMRSLEEVADVDSDNLTADTDSGYQFNYISLEDVDKGTLRSFSDQRFSSAPSRARRRVRPGDVLVSTVRPNLKSHLLFSASEGDWVCSTGFSLVRCRRWLANPGFVYQHLFHGAVPKQIEALIAGSNYPAISAKDVRAFQIPMPSVEEQTAIAAVLSDMDAEIAALEARREKTRRIKQGMMQELLTGRTRLV